jgi:hypothetical protein
MTLTHFPEAWEPVGKFGRVNGVSRISLPRPALIEELHDLDSYDTGTTHAMDEIRTTREGSSAQRIVRADPMTISYQSFQRSDCAAECPFPTADLVVKLRGIAVKANPELQRAVLPEPPSLLCMDS